MDSITHTLVGLTSYGTINKAEKEPEHKKVLLFAAIAGSQIPDIDAVVQLTEKGSIMYQMWHRGLSHSVFLAPLWALLIYFVGYLIWKRKEKLILGIAFINILVHIGLDSLNTWGTGLFEPFSQVRVTLGFIPIVDFFLWLVILAGFLVIKFKKDLPRHKVWQTVCFVILIHIFLQGTQGYFIQKEAKGVYQEVALSANFVPWHFTVIGKNESRIEIYGKTLWDEKKPKNSLESQEEADLTPLFRENPRAEVLLAWSPFVVVVDDEKKLGIFDPRFYRNGNSFLFEYIEK